MTPEEIQKSFAANEKQKNELRAALSEQGNNVFTPPKPTLSSAFSAAVSDPVLPLFVLTAVIVTILLNDLWAVLAVALVGIGLCVGAALLYRSRSTLALSAEYLVPTARRAEGKRILRTQSRKLVPGDILKIREGDIVPADGRLISSDGLIVREIVTDPSDGNISRCRMAKDAKKTYRDRDEEESYANMVYAGSVVLAGSAAVLVTDVGKATREGVLHNGVPLPDTSRLPAPFARFIQSTRSFSTFLLICVLPLTAAWLLLRPKNDPTVPTLAEIFFLILASACSSAPLCVGMAGEHLLGHAVETLRKNCGAVLIRPEDLVPVACTDTLILTDPALLIDPSDALRLVWAAEKEYFGPALTSEQLTPAAHLASVLCDAAARAEENAPEGPLANDLRYFSAFSTRFDPQKIGAGKDSIVFSGRTETGFAVVIRERTAAEASHAGDPARSVISEFTLTVSTDLTAADGCVFYRRPDGERSAVNSSFTDLLHSAADACRKDGKRVYLLTTRSTDGLYTFEAFFSVGSYVPYVGASTISAMRKYGVDSKLFVTPSFPEMTDPTVFFGAGADVGTLDLADFRAAGDVSDSILYALKDNSVFTSADEDALALCTSALTTAGHNVLPVVRSVREQTAAGTTASAYTAGTSEEALSETASVRFFPANDQRPGSGLAGVFETIRSAGAVLLKLDTLRNTLAFTTGARLFCLIAALLTRQYAVVHTVSALIAAGFLLDLTVIPLLSAKRITPASLRSVTAIAASSSRVGTVFSVLAALLAGTLAALLPARMPEDFFEPGAGAVYFGLTLAFFSCAAALSGELAWKFKQCKGKFSPLAAVLFAAVASAVTVSALVLDVPHAALLSLVPAVGAFLLFCGAQYLAVRVLMRRAERNEIVK